MTGQTQKAHRYSRWVTEFDGGRPVRAYQEYADSIDGPWLGGSPKGYDPCICGHLRREHSNVGFERCSYVHCECVSFALASGHSAVSEPDGVPPQEPGNEGPPTLSESAPVTPARSAKPSAPSGDDVGHATYPFKSQILDALRAGGHIHGTVVDAEYEDVWAVINDVLDDARVDRSVGSASVVELQERLYWVNHQREQFEHVLEDIAAEPPHGCATRKDCREAAREVLGMSTDKKSPASEDA